MLLIRTHIKSLSLGMANQINLVVPNVIHPQRPVSLAKLMHREFVNFSKFVPCMELLNHLVNLRI